MFVTWLGKHFLDTVLVSSEVLPGSVWFLWNTRSSCDWPRVIQILIWCWMLAASWHFVLLSDHITTYPQKYKTLWTFLLCSIFCMHRPWLLCLTCYVTITHNLCVVPALLLLLPFSFCLFKFSSMFFFVQIASRFGSTNFSINLLVRVPSVIFYISIPMF